MSSPLELLESETTRWHPPADHAEAIDEILRTNKTRAVRQRVSARRLNRWLRTHCPAHPQLGDRALEYWMRWRESKLGLTK